MALLNQSIAIFTAIICLAYVFWWTFVRREFFNPMIYVIFGIFHWMVVGEVGTVVLQQEYFEPRGNFPQDIHLIGTVMVLLTVLAALTGYHISGARQRLVPWSEVPNLDRLGGLTLLVGIVAGYFLYRHIKTFTADQAGFAYALWVLPLTLPTISAAVLGAFLFFRAPRLDPRHPWLYRSCGLLPLFAMMTSNVLVVFALYALVFWYFNRNGKVERVSLRSMMFLTAMVPLAMLMALTVKILQRADGDLDSVYTLGKLLAPETIEGVLYRFATLDIFNVEDYSLLLVVIERSRDLADHQWGKTYLALLPVLKFLDPTIRGMGRQLSIDVGYSGTGVSFSVPPTIELYANFGALGPVLAYLFLGIVLRVIYSWYLTSRNEFHGIVYAFVLAWVFYMQRGDALNTLLYPTYIFAVVVIIYACCKRSGYRPRSPMSLQPK
jgi:hypothetical protein